MALSGTLKDFGIADILQLIGHQTKTGKLVLKNGPEEVDVLFVVLAVAAVRTWRRRPPEVRPWVPFFGALTVVTSSESRS